MTGIGRKEYKEVLEKILSGHSVYVKDVGTKVMVTNYSKGKRSKDYDHVCEVIFEEVPDKRTIDKTDFFNVSVKDSNNLFGSENIVTAPNGKVIEITARMHIKHLRAVPFRGKASKLLYGKK